MGLVTELLFQSVSKKLTFAEEALISRIQLVMAARKLKQGMRRVKGHIVFVDRTSTIDEVADILPRLSSEIEILEFKRQSGNRFKQMFVRR